MVLQMKNPNGICKLYNMQILLYDFVSSILNVTLKIYCKFSQLSIKINV